MTDVSFKLTQAGMKAILSGEFHLLNNPITAVLLAPGYHFQNTHRTYEQVVTWEVQSPDYNPLRLTGQKVIDPANFSSDPLNFGAAVTIGPVGSVALIGACPKRLRNTSLLLAVGSFLDAGTAVESIRGAFKVTPSSSGWFALT